MSDSENIICGEHLESYTGTDGLGKVLFDSMKEHGNAIFQIDALTGKEDSFTETLSRMVRTAITLRKKYVKRGDIVAVCDYNHLNTCIPIYASLLLGATATAADHKLVLEDMTILLKKLNAKFIFTSSQAEENVMRAIRDAQVDTQIVVFDKSTFGNLEFEEFLDVSSEEEHTFEPVAIENLKTETALILFSSGSTGLPKGICLSHYAILRALTVNSGERLLGGLRILHFSGIYWLGKLWLYLVSSLANFTLVIAQFDEDRTWSWIEKYKVGILILSGMISRKIIRREEVNKVDTSSLKWLTLVGGKVYDYQMKELKDKLPHVLITQAWGMTETSGEGISFHLRDVFQVPPEKLYTALGKPAKGARYKVVDIETGKSLGPNQPGELRLKSEVQMIGYFDRDSSDAWDEDGYLKTGDLMYYDEDHYFYYVERIGEMFKYKFEYVHPNYVENIFLSHPVVKSVVVVGLPDPEDDMHPAAMVVLNECDSITAEELREYVEEKLNHRISMVGGVHIVDDIPLSCSGKVKRREIQKIIIEKRKQHAS